MAKHGLKRIKSSGGKTVGLLGGSFNPAHQTHRDISLKALQALHLDEVWWLVSPQNPLKSGKGMANLADRMASAQQMATDTRIRVTDIETRLGTRYTADTITELQRRYPHIRFVWIMGADNLAQFPRWKQWQRIANSLPIAVFNRPGYSWQALGGKAAQAMRRHRLTGRHMNKLAQAKAPAWAFFWQSRSRLSATEIRNRGGFPPADTGV